MPIYEYRCSACDRTYEVMQKLSDTPLTVCVNCSGKLTKVISTSGLVFKGSGFYINDYAAKGKGAEKTAGSEKNTEKEAKTPKAEESASTEKDKNTGEKDKKTGKGSTTPVSE